MQLGHNYPACMWLACAMGKVIGFVCLLPVIIMTIARSLHLDIWAVLKYNETVEIGEKLAWLCFKSFGKVHECHKCSDLLAMPIDCRPCAFCSCSQYQCVGKGRQHIQAWGSDAVVARWVCALESSSITLQWSLSTHACTGQLYARAQNAAYIN